MNWKKRADEAACAAGIIALGILFLVGMAIWYGRSGETFRPGVCVCLALIATIGFVLSTIKACQDRAAYAEYRSWLTVVPPSSIFERTSSGVAVAFTQSSWYPMCEATACIGNIGPREEKKCE